jgi:hypothetical protein
MGCAHECGDRTVRTTADIRRAKAEEKNRDPRNRVRTRLPAGGRRIRTIGPTEGARRPRGFGSRSCRLFRWRGIKRRRHEPLSKPWSCTRYLRFESGFLQRRVHEPSVPPRFQSVTACQNGAFISSAGPRNVGKGVPNGCSTVCLRMRIASGARSSRCCHQGLDGSNALPDPRAETGPYRNEPPRPRLQSDADNLSILGVHPLLKAITA